MTMLGCSSAAARIKKVFVDAVVGLAVTAAEDGKLRAAVAGRLPPLSPETWDVTVPELTCVGTFDKHEDSVSAVAGEVLGLRVSEPGGGFQQEQGVERRCRWLLVPLAPRGLPRNLQ